MGDFLNEIIGKIPNFVGIKYTDKNMEQGFRAIKANDGKFSVFLGCDQVMAGAFVLGFDSAIATTLNVFPQLGIEILKSVQDGNVKQAREYQNKLNEAIEVVTRNGGILLQLFYIFKMLFLGGWVQTMKEAMTILSPINCGPPREPLTRLAANQIAQMQEELKTLKL